MSRSEAIKEMLLQTQQTRAQWEGWVHGIYYWRLFDPDRTRTGVVGVHISAGWVHVAHLAGKPLPARCLYPILRAVLPAEAWEEAESLHQARPHPWKVEVRVSRGGAKYYTLLHLLEGWGFAKRISTIHISARGNLAEGLSLPLSDLPPILAAVCQDFPQARLTPPGEYPGSGEVTVRQIPPRSPDGFRAPGEPSGLVEAVG